MSYSTITPYADEAYGIAYFADRLATDPWDDATSGDRVKALKMATRAIDRLNFAGYKHDAAQALQFPRGADVTPPDDILQATCELALALLDDVDPNMEAENLNISRQNLGGFQVEMGSNFLPEHTAAGIPSLQAWTLLQPFLRDPKILDVDRS